MTWKTPFDIESTGDSTFTGEVNLPSTTNYDGSLLSDTLASKLDLEGGDTITASSASVVPLTIEAAPSQTADLINVTDNLSNKIFTVLGGGDVRIGGSTIGTGRLGIKSQDDEDFVVGYIIGGNYYTLMRQVARHTTANAANVYIDSGNYVVVRSTSSIKYKTDVETLSDEYADKVLKLRPVWYRSLSDVDKSEWSHYGLIAEEVADVDPRLVNFTESEDGELEPEGVQYDRLVPHLINIVQRQKSQIDALTARLDAAGL